MAQSFTPTATFPLPLNPDSIYANILNSNKTSLPSDTAAFETGIDGRDLGCCIICGYDDLQGLAHCHIIPQSEPDTWEFMRTLGYIPTNAKKVAHESRNGILMCGLHRIAFDHYRFYIRWNSPTNEFVVVNHSRMDTYENIHGRVLHFDTNTKRCPFPTAFLWHESRVRGFHPVYGDRPVTFKRGVLRGGGPSGRHGVEDSTNGSTCATKQVEGRDTHAPDVPSVSSFIPRPLVGDELTAWLEAARQHASWRDCMVENTSWNGTAEENIAKYQHEIGILGDRVIIPRDHGSAPRC